MKPRVVVSTNSVIFVRRSDASSPTSKPLLSNTQQMLMRSKASLHQNSPFPSCKHVSYSICGEIDRPSSPKAEAATMLKRTQQKRKRLVCRRLPMMLGAVSRNVGGSRRIHATMDERVINKRGNNIPARPQSAIVSRRDTLLIPAKEVQVSKQEVYRPLIKEKKPCSQRLNVQKKPRPSSSSKHEFICSLKRIIQRANNYIQGESNLKLRYLYNFLLSK